MKGWFVLLAILGCETRSRPVSVIANDAEVPRNVAVDAGLDAEIDVSLVSRLDALAPIGRAPKPLLRRHHSGDCSTKHSPRPDRDANPMCRVAGGTFQMGGAFDEPPPSHIVSSHPTPRTTTVGNFDIDQFGVRAPQVALFLNSHGNHCPGLHVKMAHPETRCVGSLERNGLRERDGKVEVIPGHQNMVVEDFSVEGAMRYCAWVGKQLVTSAQWEYAARHDPRTARDLIYPWGDSWRANHSCTTRGTCTREWERYRGVNIAGLFDGTRGRSDGSSPFGVHDMIDVAPELVVVCDDPNTTCHPGRPCPCKIATTAVGQFDPALATTFARFKFFPTGAVRCVVPR